MHLGPLVLLAPSDPLDPEESVDEMDQMGLLVSEVLMVQLDRQVNLEVSAKLVHLDSLV